jgi:hypothetical protein
MKLSRIWPAAAEAAVIVNSFFEAQNAKTSDKIDLKKAMSKNRQPEEMVANRMIFNTYL